MTQERGVARGAMARPFLSVLPRAVAYWEVWPILAFALALELVYLHAAPVVGLPFDDSYISLLFARNLAHHGFLTFDGQHASGGATSLLHVAALAAPIKLGFDPVKASVGFGLALQLGLVVAVYWLAHTIFRDRLSAALAAASAAIMGYLVYDALNGMETVLFLLLSTLAAAAVFRARNERGFLIAGVAGALTVLARPEGVLFAGAMALYYIVNPNRGDTIVSPRALRRLALLAGPTVLALIGLVLFYAVTTGSPTPGAATAKLLFFREFELAPRVKFDSAQSGLANFAGPLLPWLALAAFAVRRREVLLFAFFWIAFVSMYAVLFPGGLTHYWYRYQHVFLPPIATFAGAGAASLLRARELRGWNLVSGAIIAIMLVGYMLFQYNSFRNHYGDDVRVNQGRQVAVALYLRAVVPPGDTIATHDIGAIGYFSDRKVIDLVGLVNHDAVGYHDGRRLREYVDKVQPDYIVVFRAGKTCFCTSAWPTHRPSSNR